MVWAPNTGLGYPYGSSFANLGTTAADRLLLDTNRDNVLSELDDPYLPYYPGDDFVDWVGLSSYW